MLVMVVARVTWGALAWKPGWSALTWDDFTRVALAQQWAAQPFLTSDLVWLPLPYWVNGLAFKAWGQRFATDPMALVAVINTTAVVLTAVLIGWSAWRIFRSRGGALVAFAAILFSPWGFFTSLSGLVEPLYYLAVAGAVSGLIAWLETGRLRALLLGAIAVALSAAIRYEGWWLAAAWPILIGAPELWRIWRRRPAWQLRGSAPLLGAALAPLAVPAGWMLLNLARVGNPLFFAEESARKFLNAYGGDLFDSVPERILYYPVSLFRSAPLLIIAIAVIAWRSRADRVVAHVSFLSIAAFLFLYTTSLFSPVVGAFNERYMFAFVVAVAPLLGGVAEVLSAISSRLRRLTVAVVALAVVITVTWDRASDRPVEWAFAPDLLALGTALGDLAGATEPVRVAISAAVVHEHIPLSVQNGSQVQVVVASGDVATVPSGIDILIERIPERIRQIPAEPATVIGRYHLYGPKAHLVPVETGECGCDAWTFHDEEGTATKVAPGPFLALEFVTDDPHPGAEAYLRTPIPRRATPTTGSVEFRWLYGHGFNKGRITVEVRVDGTAVFSRDIATPSRWTTVEFAVPAGPGTSTLDVAIVAQPGIETGWAWGRASTVMVRSLEQARP